MAKVSEVKIGGGSAHLGTFHCKTFNLFEQESMDEYADLRTRANNAASGIKIEQIREYSRKTVIREGGDDGIVTTTEDIFLVVHYWERKPKRTKGDMEDEVTNLALKRVSADR